MDVKGQAFFVSLMIALVFIVFALAVGPSLVQFSDNARNSSTLDSVGLNCTSSLITNFDKANCVFVDYLPPLFVGFLIFAAGAIIASRIIA